MTPNEKAALIAEHLANHDAHGYSQENRDGTGWTEQVDVGDGIPVTLHDEYDCSALAIECYKCQGIDTGYATYTMNMFYLMDTGNFDSVPIENMKRGDILNSTVNRHAAIYLGNGKIAEALRGDSPDGLGGEVGDQDGMEIRITDYYDDRWTACYHCIAQYYDGWVQINGYWYYYKDNEMVVNDWVKWNGKWYYLNCNGVMLRSRWVKDVDGDWWYYVNENGEMVRNEPVPYKDGYCWANSNGRVYENQELKIVGWYIVGA